MEKLIKILLSILFITIGGVLFWQGLDQIFEGLDNGQGFLYVFIRNSWWFVMNIVGALACLLYAFMPWISNEK